jgi:hypothetical protein
MVKARQRYNYFVEDGQCSFEVTLGRLLGSEGQVVSLGIEGENDHSKTYILAIKGFDVYCIGTVENSIPKAQEDIERWKEHWGIGHGHDDREYEVVYLAADTEWSPKKEMKEVIVGESESDVRDQFHKLCPDCTIHRIVEL